jgi:hypothetical protein
VFEDAGVDEAVDQSAGSFDADTSVAASGDRLEGMFGQRERTGRRGLEAGAGADEVAEHVECRLSVAVAELGLLRR